MSDKALGINYSNFSRYLEEQYDDDNDDDYGDMEDDDNDLNNVVAEDEDGGLNQSVSFAMEAPLDKLQHINRHRRERVVSGEIHIRAHPHKNNILLLLPLITHF